MKTKMKALTLALCAVLLVATTVFVTVAYLTDTTEVVENTFSVGNVIITLDETDYDMDDDTDDQKTYTYEDTSRPDKIRDIENKYKLLPGITYPKDPTVHVEVGSEPSYIRMIVTVTYNEAADTILDESWLDLNTTAWSVQNGGSPITTKANGKITREYEFYYYKVVSTLDGEAKEVTIDEYGRVTKEDALELNESSVTVVTDGKSVTTVYFDLEDLFTEITVPEDITNDELAALEDLKINVEAHAIQAAGFANADAAWAAFDAQ